MSGIPVSGTIGAAGTIRRTGLVGTAVDILRALRLVSLAEATSFLLLLVATAVKYGAAAPLGVKILGPIHGVLFLGYVGLVLLAREQAGWNGSRTLLALAAGVLPFAPYYVERNWLRAPAPARS
jgi:integral membrane protein